jgi:glycolate oxidase
VTTTAAPPDLLARLESVLPADRVVTDADVLASYAHDEAEWAEHALPACVVRPRTAEEV